MEQNGSTSIGSGIYSRGDYPYPLSTPDIYMETETNGWNSQQKANLPPGEIDSKAWTYPAILMGYECARDNRVIPVCSQIIIRCVCFSIFLRQR
jgi:hypothetical protein